MLGDTGHDRRRTDRLGRAAAGARGDRARRARRVDARGARRGRAGRDRAAPCSDASRPVRSTTPASRRARPCAIGREPAGAWRSARWSAPSSWSRPARSPRATSTWPSANVSAVEAQLADAKSRLASRRASARRRGHSRADRRHRLEEGRQPSATWSASAPSSSPSSTRRRCGSRRRCRPKTCRSCRSGATVEFTVRGYDQTFQGRIERIAPQADSTTRQVPIYVAIPNVGGRLVAGLFAEGRVVAQSASGLIVPVNAVNTSSHDAVGAARDGREDRARQRHARACAIRARNGCWSRPACLRRRHAAARRVAGHHAGIPCGSAARGQLTCISPIPPSPSRSSPSSRC